MHVTMHAPMQCLGPKRMNKKITYWSNVRPTTSPITNAITPNILLATSEFHEPGSNRTNSHPQSGDRSRTLVRKSISMRHLLPYWFRFLLQIDLDAVNCIRECFSKCQNRSPVAARKELKVNVLRSSSRSFRTWSEGFVRM